MRRDDELSEFMRCLFRAYRVENVVKIKTINYKYDGCTVHIITASGQNVGCRLKYHTDNDVIAWIKSKYDIVDTQWYGYDPETLVTIMAVRKNG
nr:MAG TPA_asm: hypothetical protein [Caudoviricetes sp.]